jgi:hypothetical protein
MLRGRQLTARNLARQGNLFHWLTFMFLSFSEHTVNCPHLRETSHWKFVTAFFSTLEKREFRSIFSYLVLYRWQFSLFHRRRLYWLEDRRSNVRCRILGKPFFCIATFHKTVNQIMFWFLMYFNVFCYSLCWKEKINFSYLIFVIAPTNAHIISIKL